MKKLESYYVLIDNKKQAEQYKYILTAAGIDTSNFVIDDYDAGCREIGYSSRGGFWLSGGYSRESNYEKVSIGQLIDLLNEPKKIAVKVENEKDFKALMKYYDSLGWKPWGEHNIDGSFNNGDCIDFHDEYRSELMSIQKDQCYQIIPFSEFAAEHNIKLPLLTSEDGVDLYDGDAAFPVKDNEIINQCDYVVTKQTHNGISRGYKYFSTKQAALLWIEAQKPKEKPICKQTIALKKSADLWNAFVGIKYSEKHPDDTNDFRFHIHALQNILYTQKHVKDHGKI